MRRLTAVIALCFCTIGLFACKGSSTSSGTTVTGPSVAGDNVMELLVNPGPVGNSVNSGFVNVTICTPGTSQCQTVSDVVVDTGSYGLRLLASEVTISLPTETNSSGDAVVECAYFGSFTTWGPIKTAAVGLGKEPLVNVPIQILNDPNFPPPPSSGCTGQACQCITNALNPTIATTPQIIGANGILGVGVFPNDCGAPCSTPPGSGNPGYYLCPPNNTSACTVAPVPDSEQAQNPVSLLPTDNQGVLVDLPAIPATGASSVQGSLILGINTQSNNQLGNATVYELDPSTGELTTTFNGQSLPGFIDTGSNALFFPDSSIPTCSDNPGFYCPSSTLSLSATNTGTNNATGSVVFQIANADQLFSNNSGSNTAFNDLGGPLSGFFDWGLPFFYGRPIFFGIAGQNPSISGSNPFYAY